jgi:hypothetical protein
MKTLNVKRISAVAAGAALLAVGFAFAGQITYNNIQIISAQGTPMVQIVVGSHAQPSDGVAAGNLAAAIGNLAFSSTPVTTVVNTTKAQSLLSVQVSNTGGSSGSLSGGQVWLNETGKTGVSATSYPLDALIGSVLNEGLTKSSLIHTKATQGSATYAHNETTSYSSAISQPSPYTAYGSVPTNGTVTGTTNGGGVSFSSFTNGTFDNLVEVTHSQFNPLVSNNGTYGETEYLWLSGFPVYNQQYQKFMSMSTDVAYQALFNKPIQAFVNNAVNNAEFQFLGQTWTLINVSKFNQGTVASSGVFKKGGRIEIASSLVPTQSVNVGNTISSGNFNVTLFDLGQTNSSGTVPAIVDVAYDGAIIKPKGYEYAIWPGNTVKFNTTTGQSIFVHVNSTVAGQYFYAHAAKMELWSNVYNLTDGTQFNKTVNPGWYVNLLWTNTSSSGGNANALYGITILNQTGYNLASGGTIPIAQSPSPWTLTFGPDTLGNNFDTVTLTTSGTTSAHYTNKAAVTTVANLDIPNITEPAQLLTVKSTIPAAFQYGAQKANNVTYDLTPYELNEIGNVLTANAAWALTNGHGGPQGSTVSNVLGTSVAVVYNNAGTDSSAWAQNTVITIKGYQIVSGKIQSTATTTSNTLIGNDTTWVIPSVTFFNVTGIQLNHALPPGGMLDIAIGVNGIVPQSGKMLNTGDTANMLANVISVGSAGGSPGLLYYQNGATYNETLDTTNVNNVNYQQYNGEQSTLWTITGEHVTGTGQGLYYTYAVNEIAVPGTVEFDQLEVGLKNSTSGITDPNMFMINYSAGTGGKLNGTYVSTYGQTLAAPQGFRTERGSVLTSINGASPRTDTINLAKTEDYLQYTLSTSGTNAVTSYTICPSLTNAGLQEGSSLKSCGIANTTIFKISGNVTLGSGAKYTISGLGNLSQAVTTSPASVDNVTLLKDVGSTAPLVVLDSQANPASALILIGSGYVNSLSQQLQQAQGIGNLTPSSPPIMQAYAGSGTAGGKILLAGYSAQNTTAEVDAFIQYLYSQASS